MYAVKDAFGRERAMGRGKGGKREIKGKAKHH